MLALALVLGALGATTLAGAELLPERTAVPVAPIVPAQAAADGDAAGPADPAPAEEPAPDEGAGPGGPRDDGTAPEAAPDEPATGEPTAPPDERREGADAGVPLTLVAAGDVLLHTPVLASARTGEGYDFTPLLAPLRPWVAGADLALCHLEVPVAPEGTAPSGFPLFGAPAQIARDLRANGWDGCSTASNHSLDRGLDGVVRTLDALDEAGLGHVGTARTAEEAAAPQVYALERSGRTVRVAHLAATYGTNGVPVPASAPWAVQRIDVGRLVEQARLARESGADLVLASVHCCTEYVSEPTAEQVRIAEALGASAVVDLLIGHHAHVPQPLRRVPGGPGGDGMWVAYGLGNMISNQDAACCTARTDSGLVLTATATVPPTGPVRVTGAEWTALTVERTGGHRVHPLPSTRLDRPAGVLGAPEVAVRHARVREVMGSDAPERVTPATASGPAPRVLPRP